MERCHWQLNPNGRLVSFGFFVPGDEVDERARARNPRVSAAARPGRGLRRVGAWRGARARARAVGRISPGSRRSIAASVRCAGSSVATCRGIPEPVPELDEPLARLRVAGIMWSAPELLGGAVLLRSARRTREALRDERRPAVLRAVLAPFVERMVRRARGRGGDRARDRRGRPRARRCVAGAAAHPARAARVAGRADSHSRARDGRSRVASPRARHVRHRAQGPLRDPGAREGVRAGRRHRARRVRHRRHAVRRAAGGGRVRQPHPRARERGAGRGRAHPARAHRSSFARIATR